MTVHHDKFLVNKINRCTGFQFYWYYDSTCFGQPFCPSSGVLSRTSALVRFMQFWLQFAVIKTGRKRSSKLPKIYQCRCTANNSRWWAERLPKTCRVVIQIKLDSSGSVGFIHKEYIHIYIYIHTYIYTKWRQNFACPSHEGIKPRVAELQSLYGQERTPVHTGWALETVWKFQRREKYLHLLGFELSTFQTVAYRRRNSDSIIRKTNYIIKDFIYQLTYNRFVSKE